MKPRPRGGSPSGPRSGSLARPAGERCPYLPSDTARCIGRWIQAGEELHPGLLAQRYLAPGQQGPPPAVDGRATYERVVSLGRAAVRRGVAVFGGRTRSIADSLRGQGLAVEERVVRVGWRLTMGLGGEHPAELGFTLHRMGFPYLPASGLKGLAREVARARLPGADLNRLFGTPGGPGMVRFFDGLPLPGRERYLELDVMNPHAADYYRGSDWPRPWQNPIPLWFLTVPAGTCFRLVVAAVAPEDARTAMDLLLDGLATQGAAAKRAAGYGWFEEVDDGA